jgi:beta-galactosamide-alpha-2,3-sialyltransferase
MKEKNLFLCRTPFQALFCIYIINKLSLNKVDIIYFTQNNNETDMYYFNSLRKINTNGETHYIYIKPQKFDLLSHIKLFFLIKSKIKKSYDRLFFSSLDNPAFKKIIQLVRPQSLITFDDGIANIIGEHSYYNATLFKKMYIYNFLFRIPSLVDIKNSIELHFSIYEGFNNIVVNEKIEFINLFHKINTFKNDSVNKQSKYFIGQPFHEYMNTSEISVLKKWIAEQSIDFYIMHPRETDPIVKSIPLLNKNGLLAEDAIFQNASNRPIIISAFSSVLFNISIRHADKLYISITCNSEEKRRLELIRKTGASIYKIYQKETKRGSCE